MFEVVNIKKYNSILLLDIQNYLLLFFEASLSLKEEGLFTYLAKRSKKKQKLHVSYRSDLLFMVMTVQSELKKKFILNKKVFIS